MTERRDVNLNERRTVFAPDRDGRLVRDVVLAAAGGVVVGLAGSVALLGALNGDGNAWAHAAEDLRAVCTSPAILALLACVGIVVAWLAHEVRRRS